MQHADKSLVIVRMKIWSVLLPLDLRQDLFCAILVITCQFDHKVELNDNKD